MKEIVSRFFRKNHERSEDISPNSADQKKKKYNLLCLTLMIISVIFALLWAIFSAFFSPEENAVGVYGNEGERTVQEAALDE